MSGKVTQFMKTQKYRFDFGTDGKLYVVIFNGKIPQAELKGLLSSLHNRLYGKIPDIIPLYLKQRHLEYSNFNSIEIPLENYNAMEWAAYLLHSGTYGKVDETLGDGTCPPRSPVSGYHKTLTARCNGSGHRSARINRSLPVPPKLSADPARTLCPPVKAPSGAVCRNVLMMFPSSRHNASSASSQDPHRTGASASWTALKPPAVPILPAPVSL